MIGPAEMSAMNNSTRIALSNNSRGKASSDRIHLSKSKTEQITLWDIFCAFIELCGLIVIIKYLIKVIKK